MASISEITNINIFCNHVYEYYGYNKRRFLRKKLYRYKIQRNSKQLAAYSNYTNYRQLANLKNIF